MSELLNYRVSQADVAVILFEAQEQGALELLRYLEDAS